jgi:hypothetical protein
MYELDNRKDQIMTVCKVALANLGMWVRDRYFPASYAHASWHRLHPFSNCQG